MAKSKTGGTRAMIRGRVGSDVYSVGLNGNGEKQQVVRSLAEVVANPQTTAQMRGRMIMSTVMQAVAAMRPIIDHSFDGITTGQPSISHFISVNYAALKADVAAHPSSDNRFGLNKYQEKGAKAGKWIVSDGQAVLPSEVSIASNQLTLYDGNNAAKVSDLISALGMSYDDYLTAVAVKSDGTFTYVRLRLNPEVATTATISASLSNLFLTEGNVSISFTFNEVEDTNVLIGTISGGGSCSGVIITKKTASGYIHSKCELPGEIDADFNADTALATYPIGTSMFLNGGDL